LHLPVAGSAKTNLAGRLRSAVTAVQVPSAPPMAAVFRILETAPAEMGLPAARRFRIEAAILLQDGP